MAVRAGLGAIGAQVAQWELVITVRLCAQSLNPCDAKLITREAVLGSRAGCPMFYCSSLRFSCKIFERGDNVSEEQCVNKHAIALP